MPDVMLEPDAIAFPILAQAELAALEPLAVYCEFEDGEVVFRAGEPEVDLFVVESGALEVLNPTDEDRHVVTHGPGHFAGDIDLLTKRPVIVTGVARGHTRLLRVPSRNVREVLTKIPQISDKLLSAAQKRRQLLARSGTLGLKVVGPGKCPDTMLVRELLFENFVPFTWYDSASEQGAKLLEEWGSPKYTPAVQYGGGRLLFNPSLHELAEVAGVWEDCPTTPVDLAIVGAGSAGMTAAVYSASEGISTPVLDRMGPGGQAGASSKIENFIGFPTGLSGAELAERSVLQMLKFGAHIVAPAEAKRLERSTC